MSAQVYNANDLMSGRVVYLTAAGSWSERIADAAVFENEADAERLKAIAETALEARIVVDAYPIEIAIADGNVRPKIYRERVRAEGPSVRTDLGKQAANG
jgi:sulfite reductase (NADPH) hemoprotein beta-component